ncbi:MAG: 30S ribosomal protein S18 [Spirochaetes bacterium]|nr:30S ribosomal protein S18 [Spirochaetota bacterium]
MPKENTAAPETTVREEEPEFPRARRAPYQGKESMDKRGMQKGAKYKKKFCRFCHNKNLKINYRDAQLLEGFITERGKILPRRITGTCAKHQRDLSRGIKQARILSLLPFVVK